MRWAIAAALLVFCVGCSSSRLPVVDDLAYDSQQAKELLVGVLEAWKKGQAAGLVRRQPPIRFVDDDWAGGWQLADYEINEAGYPLQPFKNIAVVLKLRNRQGDVVQKHATYQIVLGRSPAVLRTDT